MRRLQDLNDPKIAVRPMNVLYNLHVETDEQLSKLVLQEFLKTNGAGRKLALQVRRFAARHGIPLHETWDWEGLDPDPDDLIQRIEAVEEEIKQLKDTATLRYGIKVYLHRSSGRVFLVPAGYDARFRSVFSDKLGIFEEIQVFGSRPVLIHALGPDHLDVSHLEDSKNPTI